MAGKYWFANHPSGRVLAYSGTLDPAAFSADEEDQVGDVTVTGAALGDIVIASFGIDVADVTLSAQVTAADTVTWHLKNTSGTADLNLGSSTLRLLVIPGGAVDDIAAKM
tara:strand:- start:10367 stop:10696 length:330 start_codon:yes stop_codon:yes gene_type:complete